MINKLLTYCILIFSNLIMFGQDMHIEAFTHPLSDINQKVSLYSNPDVYYKELKSDKEAGWTVVIKQKKDNYFQIDIQDLKLYNKWIHKGDLGVVVQNYDSTAIPVYSLPSINSPKLTYIY